MPQQVSVKLWVVSKAPVDLIGAYALRGVYLNRALARQACKTPGTYMIAAMEVNRTYQTGQLIDVEIIDIMDHRQV